jgi:hypothetical protein
LAVVNTLLKREQESYVREGQVAPLQTGGLVKVSSSSHVGLQIQWELLIALDGLLKCECGNPVYLLPLQGARFYSLIRGMCLMVHSIWIREDFMREPHFEALPFFYASPSR